MEFHQNRAGGGSLQENGVNSHFKEDLIINRKEESGKKKVFRVQKQRKKASEEVTAIKSMMEGIPEKIKNFCQK